MIRPRNAYVFMAQAPLPIHPISYCLLLKKPHSFICQTPKLLKWSVALDKVVRPVNKGQECIKHPNPLTCNGYPGFVIAKVHSFKVKRLVPRLSPVSLSTCAFRCICDCCSFLDMNTTFLYLYLSLLLSHFFDLFKL